MQLKNKNADIHTKKDPNVETWKWTELKLSIINLKQKNGAEFSIEMIGPRVPKNMPELKPHKSIFSNVFDKKKKRRENAIFFSRFHQEMAQNIDGIFRLENWTPDTSIMNRSNQNRRESFYATLENVWDKHYSTTCADFPLFNWQQATAHQRSDCQSQVSYLRLNSRFWFVCY